MKKLVVLLVLLIASTACADNYDICNQVNRLAVSVMDARQAGVTIQRLMQYVNEDAHVDLKVLLRLLVIEYCKHIRGPPYVMPQSSVALLLFST